MDHLDDDMTLSDVTVMVDKDYYASKKPSDFEFYRDNPDGDEDTDTRMGLEAR